MPRSKMWICHACGNLNDFDLFPRDYCIICRHDWCDHCTPLDSDSRRFYRELWGIHHQVTTDPPVTVAEDKYEVDSEGDADSDISETASSVFSDITGSSHTSADLRDMTEAGTSILVDLLSEDRLVISCCEDALHGARFRAETVQNKLRRLLKQSAIHMKSDPFPDPYDR
ncbi:uncharacterized protein DSM5745_06838 [Aspergillus mulundensis]|uniref:Uncharacterized protein n=1 Tax=Aspergillus mulundensis TaxID=1810919 RepID=A0A3D8RSC0_9EURO|nr:hypothetical protein DSM5745_06838 [Aspergillus mulundensis]RDW76846.1 hypothetical protein DSM5745_06838 [Aspergillus mulundensis]